MIGSLGRLYFEASSELVRTFADASLGVSARWASHEVIARKPAAEFLGPASRTLSMSLRLDSGLGVDPGAEIVALRAACEAGEVLPLILGGEPAGDWVLKELGEAWRQVRGDGTIGVIEVELSLGEYA